MKISVGSLVLEVTRRCNMHCPHCIRGEAQSLDMSKETVDKLLEMVSDIGHICFTGGEPSLNLPIIQYTFERVNEKFGYTPPFFVATNGKENQMDLMQVLAKAYVQCPSPEICSVAISVDQFHERSRSAEDYLRALAFYSDCKEHQGLDDGWVQKKGLALDNGLGQPPQNKAQKLYIDTWSDGTVSVEDLVLCADEGIRSNCDYEYEDDESILCSLDELQSYVSAQLAEMES